MKNNDKKKELLYFCWFKSSQCQLLNNSQQKAKAQTLENFITAQIL